MNLEQFKRYWVIGSISYTVLLSVLLALLIGASVSETYKVVYYENELRYLPSLSMQRGSTITDVKLPVTINHAKAGERIVLRGAYETKQQDSLMVNV